MNAKQTEQMPDEQQSGVRPANSGSGWAAFSAARRNLKMTQKRVAASMGVHLMTVSGWERGLFAPARRHWSGLSELLGLDLIQIAQHCAFFSPAGKSDL